MNVVGLSPSELLARMADVKALTILDVRSSWEFVRGHVPGAIHVPFWRVPAHDAGAHPVVVYCGLGPRAWYAAALLRRRGVPNVSCLDGHISRWRREGRPEER